MSPKAGLIKFTHRSYIIANTRWHLILSRDHAREILQFQVTEALTVTFSVV